MDARDVPFSLHDGGISAPVRGQFRGRSAPATPEQMEDFKEAAEEEAGIEPEKPTEQSV